jgi:hypothetical protein
MSLGVVTLGLGLLGSFIFAAETLRLVIDLQETQATVTARWHYSPPPDYETWYEYVVVNEASADTVVRDSTALQEAQVVLQRVETDIVYRFGVRVWVEDALGGTNHSDWFDERFLVPARPDAILLAKRDFVTSPTIIPYDPAFEQPDGTLWLEFETTADVQTNQGLWSRDANGYEGGGHLSVWIESGSVLARIQSDSTSYQLQWPVVANATNQVAVEFGAAGFNFHVNGALAMSDPYTGGTVGNANDIVVGASKQSYRDTVPDQPWTNPFQGTVRESEYYLGTYDFSGRWGLPPVPPPPPVDSMSIEVAQIDHGQVVPQLLWEGQPTEVDYFVVRFAPIREARWIVRFVEGDTLDHYGKWVPATLPVAGGPWRVSQSSSDGWQMYHTETFEQCFVPSSGWTANGSHPCFTRDELLSHVERNYDCVGGRYWAKHNSEIECNFNINISQRAGFTFPRGTNPLLRFEVFDQNRQRIGYWERRVT